MTALAAFLCGLLFSAGLVLSGMTVPANVAGFLDFFGAWRPAMALVMAGAVGVYAALRPFVLRRKAPLLATAFDEPQARGVDARLLAGSAAFGAGWGLAGICPGPALAALGTGAPEAAVFCVFMAAGMTLHGLASGERGPGAGGGGCG